jgi:hypothetical protein
VLESLPDGVQQDVVAERLRQELDGALRKLEEATTAA